MLSDLSIQAVGSEAIISIKNTEDKVIIHNYLESPNNYMLEIDGKTVAVKDNITSSGSSFIVGTNGADNIIASDKKNIIMGGDGHDCVTGGKSTDTIFGDADYDRILVSDGNDVVYGGTGNDYRNGGDGSDILDGGQGTDFIDGGKGDDTYIFKLGYGSDTIQDSNGNNTLEQGNQDAAIEFLRSAADNALKSIRTPQNSKPESLLANDIEIESAITGDFQRLQMSTMLSDPKYDSLRPDAPLVPSVPNGTSDAKLPL